MRRGVIEDAKFHSPLVSRLVNVVMSSGKKATAQKIVYGTFDRIAEKNPQSNPLEILQRAVDNAKPRLEVKARLPDLNLETSLTIERESGLSDAMLNEWGQKLKGGQGPLKPV